ncbi:hypothetical protein [Flavobacterium denitrificans]|uniref:hypothetical protein n=1 Tax=Flavobacterium denitrificans TaxID=281361 RepID=UPI00041F0713|nr:hypothetical protein [Flavobacterium denitrificans]
MIKKIKNVVKAIYASKRLNEELLWANVFHDSIKETWADKIAFNIGRWAGSYAFFYVLFRILNDYKPKNILEFGLGESTKMISKYIVANGEYKKHIVIEQDENWKNIYLNNNSNTLSGNSIIKIMPMIEKTYKGATYKSYNNIESIKDISFDFYLIDGPHGSENFSRFDIFTILKDKSPLDEFIILFDDYERFGEKQTVDEVVKMLESKKIKLFTKSYTGVKSVFIVATEKYKYATSF